MSRVFIVQEPKARKESGWLPDFSTAEEYGRLVHVFKASHHPSYMNKLDLHKHLDMVLRDFDAHKDYILWSGGDAAALIHVSAYIAKRFGSVQMLRWDNRRNEQKQRIGGYYKPVTLVFED